MPQVAPNARVEALTPGPQDGCLEMTLKEESQFFQVTLRLLALLTPSQSFLPTEVPSSLLPG